MLLDFADIKPSILNWVLTGLMAITFIVLAKWYVNQYDNMVTKNLKDIINAV